MPPIVARLLLDVSGPEFESHWPQVVVELVLHDPRLHAHPLLLDVALEDIAHVLGEVDLDGVADGLPRETGPAPAPRQDRHFVARGDAADGGYVRPRLWG